MTLAASALAENVVRLQLQPLTIGEARDFVGEHHRHHAAPLSALFAVGLNDGERVVGVAMVGRPTARLLQDGYTAEVTRLCVLDGHRNACSMLYSAAWRAARAMGYRRVVTYILDSELGTSLVAAGWRLVGEVRAKTWHTPSRPRVDRAPLQAKLRWERIVTTPAVDRLTKRADEAAPSAGEREEPANG